MKLSLEEVEHIAWLARLDLTEAEKRQYAEQLSEILDYAARLNELDTGTIPPTSRVFDQPLRLREDHARLGLPRQVMLENAPETQDEQFKVPPVFGE